MIDLETLNTRPDSVILTIGAVKFNSHDTGIIDRFYMKPDVDEQLDLGRSVDESTIEWWSKQNQEAREEAFSVSGRTSYKDSIASLAKFCWNSSRVWSNGASFDIVLVEHAMSQLEIVFPWRHWEIRDTRTLWDVTGVKLTDNGNVTLHKADVDAEKQALAVQRSYKVLLKHGLGRAI